MVRRLHCAARSAVSGGAQQLSGGGESEWTSGDCLPCRTTGFSREDTRSAPVGGPMSRRVLIAACLSLLAVFSCGSHKKSVATVPKIDAPDWYTSPPRDNDRLIGVA